MARAELWALLDRAVLVPTSYFVNLATFTHSHIHPDPLGINLGLHPHQPYLRPFVNEKKLRYTTSNFYWASMINYYRDATGIRKEFFERHAGFLPHLFHSFHA